MSLSEKIVKRISGIMEERSEVVFAYLFGSKMNNKVRYGSDLDIGIYFNNNPDLLTIGELVVKLEDETKQKIDLVKLNHLDKINPSLAYSVLDTGVLICNKNDKTIHEFKSSVIINFLDFSYTNNLFEKAFKNRMMTNNFAVFDK